MADAREWWAEHVAEYTDIETQQEIVIRFDEALDAYASHKMQGVAEKIAKKFPIYGLTHDEFKSAIAALIEQERKA